MVYEDRLEFSAILVYSFLNSILLLAVPLAAQGLVNVVVAGLYLQPLIVLAGALFLGLLFAGLLSVIRFYLVEVMRERIFARVALRVSERLPLVNHRALAEGNGPELMNRFFDVINVQKSWFKLAYEGPRALLEILVGLTLLALYGVELLFLGLGLLGFGLMVIVLAGYDGLRSSLSESAQKYRVAEWLEEMVRCHDAVKLNSAPDFWLKETDRRVVDFLTDRRRHFRVVLRQHMFYYALAAASLAVMLGMGGYLVLQGQLTLGQLVAAELVVWSILKATEKMMGAVESFFDLLTGLDKISYITSMPCDPPGTVQLLARQGPAALRARGLHFRFSTSLPFVFKDLNLEIRPGEIVTVLGDSGAGKSTLIRLLAGFLRPQKGSVELDGLDLREVAPDSLAENVGIVLGSGEVFAGSFYDNVVTGRDSGPVELRDLLSAIGGSVELPQGVQSMLPSGGHTLSGSQRESLLLSRALLQSPGLVLFDEALYSLSECQRRELVRTFAGRCTIVSTVPVAELVQASHRILILESGRVVEEGGPKRLAGNPGSRFFQLYPRLALSLQEEPADV